MTTRTQRRIRFTVDIVIEPDGDQFHAYAPALKGLHVGGATEDEALKNAIDATELYLTSMINHGDPIPLSIVDKEVRLNGADEHEGVHTHRQDLALTLS